MLRKICNYNKYIDKYREKMLELVNNNLLPKEEKHKQMRKTMQSTLIIYKLMAQETIDLINGLSDCKRSYEKLIAKRSLLPKSFSESVEDLMKERDDCKKHIDEINDFLINTGKVICTSLDLWQSFGAGIEDLFNLCNAKPKQIQEVYRDHYENEKFSKIMMVYGLDYDHKGDWYDMRNYAPLTHSIKEYYIDFLEKAHVKYPEVREATDNKIQEMFPELSKHVVEEKKDEYGNTYIEKKKTNIIPFFYVCDDGYGLGKIIHDAKNPNHYGYELVERYSINPISRQEAYDKAWSDNYLLVKKFVSENEIEKLNNKTVYQGCNIGTWIQNQRANYKKGKLSEEQIKLLSDIGVTLNPYEENWNNFIKNLSECLKQNTTIVGKMIFNNKNVGMQITNYKAQYKKGNLSSEKYLQLKSLGIDLAKEGSLM